jgi:oligo-1,6-glucosidase
VAPDDKKLPTLGGTSGGWWKRAVVYQIYPASFADSNGDGFGDLNGIAAHLDYLVELGVDVVWLSPIYPTPWDDGGYDISDYQDVDERFGTLADFDALLASVHRRGLKLILDLVANHTSDDHAWFQQSRSSRDNPKRDWYWWRPPRAGHEPGTPGAEPTNWRSEFHQSAWQFDEVTGEYFLHLYSARQPDLNWENPEVRQAIYAMMRWWLDRGVDGFRMDVINKISKVTGLPDAPVVTDARYQPARPMYVNGPRMHEFLQEMNREAIAPYGAALLTVGETSGVTVAEARLLTDATRRELDMVFSFEHVRVDQATGRFDLLPFDLVALKAIMARWQDGLADVGWNSLYWCNHDQPRVVSRWGDDQRYRVESAKMLATILHLHRGTPYIYQGEELGMTNAPFAGIDDFADIDSLNYWAAATGAGLDGADVLAALRLMSRDNSRTPMQWDSSPDAGFSTAGFSTAGFSFGAAGAAAPWFAVNPNHDRINAVAALADPTSVWQHYRQLIELRHHDRIVTDGSFTLLLPEHPQVYAYLRELGDERLLVLGNFSGVDQVADIAEAADWAAAELELANYPAPGGSAAAIGPAAARPLVLRPWECRVYRRRG